VKKIFKKLSRKKIALRHVCEVGVYLPETSNIIDFIQAGIRTTLVEADPLIVQEIQATLGHYNITVHPVAIWDYTGTIKLSKAKASTFVSQLNGSPAQINDQYQVKEEDTFEVNCSVFSSIDDGSIDLLSIDIEGSEWYVLKHLISSPKIISIETHGKLYSNPFLQEILQWMQEHHYQVWYKDASDTVFVREDVFAVTATEKLLIRYVELRLKLRRFKKKLFR
jgi:FkbM family methyltransferase